MDDYTLLIDLHKRSERQGPGGNAETRKAIELARLAPSEPLKIADIGCGTGASAIILAQSLNAQVLAVDFLPEFIQVLEVKAEAEGFCGRIKPLVGSMEALPFQEDEFDVLWSEGAIYNMGFENGVSAWKRFLKPGGVLVVSEITWITNDRPAEIQRYWGTHYPEIDTASAKMSILELNGYSPVAYFALPESCWLDNYYRQLQDSFADFLSRNAHSDDARALVKAEEEEIALYMKYKTYYSYGVYVATKRG